MESFFSFPAKILDKLAQLFSWNMEPISTDPVQDTVSPVQPVSVPSEPQYPDARVQPVQNPTAVSTAQPSLMEKFVMAIIQYEGGNTPGTIPYKTNNGGDLRWPYGAPYPYGATGVEFGDFLTFATPLAGKQALTTYCTNVAEGKSKIYPVNCTVAQFFGVYAPVGDGNNSSAYADWVASEVGISTSDPISKLLG